MEFSRQEYFSRGSSQPRNHTQVSFIAGRFFSVWTTTKAQFGLFSPRNSPGQNTGVGSCSLLQGIFPTQGSNPGLLHCRHILYQLSLKGSPRILEWVSCPFSRESSQPRNQTRLSCIAGGFFTNWALREALIPDIQHCSSIIHIHTYIHTHTHTHTHSHSGSLPL